MAKCKPCALRKKRKAAYAQQNERCHTEWGCGRYLRLQSLQLAHLRQLGMGADRSDDGDPRNAETNTVLLCEPCHRAQEAMWRTFNRLWKAGLVDWMEPTRDGYVEFLDALSAGLAKEQKND